METKGSLVVSGPPGTATVRVRRTTPGPVRAPTQLGSGAHSQPFAPPPRPPHAHSPRYRPPRLPDPRLRNHVRAPDQLAPPRGSSRARSVVPGRTVPARALIALRLAGVGAQLALYLTVWLALWAVVPGLLPGWTSVAITSGSMAPALRPGDVVVAAPVESELGLGSVVVFAYADSGDLITHRIVGLNPDGSYVTRGDANDDPDSTSVAPEEIVGVGRLRVPFIGLPMAWYVGSDWTSLGIWLVLTLLIMWAGQFADPPPRSRDGA